MGGVGWGPTHYVVTPTRVEVELRFSWAVTIYIAYISIQNTSELPGWDDVNTLLF